MLNGKAKSLKIQQVTVVKLEEAIVRVITKFPQAENTIIFNNIDFHFATICNFEI